MKRTLTLVSLTFTFFNLQAQNTVVDFENFSLSPNSAYSPTFSAPFQAGNATFSYIWDSQYSLWDGGFSYTNIHDSTTGDYMHPYGVRAYKGFNSSEKYCVGLNESVITMAVAQSTINGFYITNTTYAYKSMALGDQFARKFGDTTGTGSGTAIAQGSYPDFFKVIIKGFKNGLLKNDSVSVYLANFTFTNNTQDYILDTWQYVNTSSLGAVDSIQFFMRSSDVGLYGINTPLYFAIDNFESTAPNPVGLSQYNLLKEQEVFPNPFTNQLNIRKEKSDSLMIRDAFGRVVYKNTVDEDHLTIDFHDLASGVYFVEFSNNESRMTKKIIKN